MKLSDFKLQRLRVSLHKLDYGELRLLGELCGFNSYNLMPESKDDFITEIIERIGDRL